MLSGKSALVSGASKGVGEQVAGRPKGWLPQHCVGTAAARLKPLLLRRTRTHARTAALPPLHVDFPPFLQARRLQWRWHRRALWCI